jgi:diguanylate cyclase (GGDEF)-like protein
MNSLDAQAGHVGIIEGDSMKITNSAGDGYEVGFAIPAAQSYTRHMYGSTTVLAIEDADRSPWRDDPARDTHPWRTFIGTTVFGGGRPVGLINFVSRKERAEPFDDSDRDFVRIVSSLVGAAFERIRVERELEAAAFIDPVTGVPNRSYFMDHLKRALAQVDRQGGKTTMLFLDLDAFKVVNDRLGHAAGDEVLRVIATRLRSVLREEDVLARIGGDEFAILQRTAQEEDATLNFAGRLVSAASEPIFVGGTMFTVGASVGIASYPRDATGAESLLNAADRAMYAAKAEGKGRARLFSSLV